MPGFLRLVSGHQRSRPRYAAPSPAQNFYSTVFNWTFKAPEAKGKDANGNVGLAKFDFNPDVTLSGTNFIASSKTPMGTWELCIS